MPTEREGDDIFVTASCECGDLTHVVKFYKITWNDQGIEYGCEFLLNHYMPWYKRIWPAIKFMFGTPSVGFDSVLLKDADREQLVTLLLGNKPSYDELYSAMAQISYCDAQCGEDAMKMRNIAFGIMHPSK